MGIINRILSLITAPFRAVGALFARRGTTGTRRVR